MRRSTACRMALPIPESSLTPAASEMPQACHRSAATPRHPWSPRHPRHRYGSSRRLLIRVRRKSSSARMLSSQEARYRVTGGVVHRSAPSLAFAGDVSAGLTLSFDHWGPSATSCGLSANGSVGLPPIPAFATSALPVEIQTVIHCGELGFQMTSVRRACERRASCRAPAGSARSDRRSWSQGQAPAATGGRPSSEPRRTPPRGRAAR